MPALLIVEDDPCTAELVRRALDSLGLDADVEVELEGETALERLRCAVPSGSLPDAVLLDLRPLGMDGTRVLAGVRSSPGLERLPVVVYTGSVLDRDERAARDAGADDFFVKPDSFTDLVERIRERLLPWLAPPLRASGS